MIFDSVVGSCEVFADVSFTDLTLRFSLINDDSADFVNLCLDLNHLNLMSSFRRDVRVGRIHQVQNGAVPQFYCPQSSGPQI